MRSEPVCRAGPAPGQREDRPITGHAAVARCLIYDAVSLGEPSRCLCGREFGRAGLEKRREERGTAETRARARWRSRRHAAEAAARGRMDGHGSASSWRSTASRCSTRRRDHLVTATYRVDFEVHALGPLRAARAVGLRQVDAAEGGRRLHEAGRRRDPAEGRAPSTRPGPDRMMVFQEFDQLLPWKTVRQNVMFPLRASGRLPRKAARGTGARTTSTKVNLAAVRRQLSAHAVGRHEAARRDRARHGDGARHPADGRAVRRARRAHAGARCRTSCCSSGTTRASPCCSSRIRSPRRSRSATASCCCRRIPGQVKAELNSAAARTRPAADGSRRSEHADPRHAVRRRRRGDASRERSPRMRPPPRCRRSPRPEIVREPVAPSAFGVVEKPLSPWERICNSRRRAQGRRCWSCWRSIWEVYARCLDNPLLFPTFAATVEAFCRRHRSSGDLLDTRADVAAGAADGLRAPASLLRGAADRRSRSRRGSAPTCSRR